MLCPVSTAIVDHVWVQFQMKEISLLAYITSQICLVFSVTSREVLHNSRPCYQYYWYTGLDGTTAPAVLSSWVVCWFNWVKPLVGS